MDVQLTVRQARWAWVGRLLVLVPLADLVGHDLVYGTSAPASSGRPLAAGHGYWLAFALGALVLAAAAALGLGERIWRLRRALAQPAGRSLQPPSADADRRISPLAYALELASLVAILYPATLGFYALQENLEALVVGSGLPGMAVLGSGAWAALALAVILVAAPAALLRWRVRVLEGRLAALARRRWPATLPARPAAGWLAQTAACRHQWCRTRLDAGRAPPA
jgi:hypothetical protein